MKSTLIISDKYRVVIDRYNHELQAVVPEHESKDGKSILESWKAIGFYPEIVQVLRAIVQLEVRDQDYVHLGEYTDKIENLYKRYSKLLKLEPADR